jgi:hypothetical protein
MFAVYRADELPGPAGRWLIARLQTAQEEASAPLRDGRVACRDVAYERIAAEFVICQSPVARCDLNRDRRWRWPAKERP